MGIHTHNLYSKKLILLTFVRCMLIYDEVSFTMGAMLEFIRTVVKSFYIFFEFIVT